MILYEIPAIIQKILILLAGLLLSFVIKDLFHRRDKSIAYLFLILSSLYSGRHIIGRTPLLSSRSENWVFRSFFQFRGFWGLRVGVPSLPTGLSIVFLNLAIWIFVLYTSMLMAERLCRAFKSLRENLFAYVLSGSIVMTSFVILLQWGEASIAEMFAINLAYGFPSSLDYLPIMQWFHPTRIAFFYGIYFYSAYYVFGHAPWQKQLFRWATLIFIIKLHPLVIYFFGGGLPVLIEHVMLFFLLIFLAAKVKLHPVNLPEPEFPFFIDITVLTLILTFGGSGLFQLSKGWPAGILFTLLYVLTSGMFLYKPILKKKLGGDLS